MAVAKKRMEFWTNCADWPAPIVIDGMSPTAYYTDGTVFNPRLVAMLRWIEDPERPGLYMIGGNFDHTLFRFSDPNVAFAFKMKFV